MNLQVIRKALVKANEMRLGVDETMGIIQMYLSIADDLEVPGIVNAPAPPPFVPVSNIRPETRNWDDLSAVEEPQPYRNLSATSPIQAQSVNTYAEKTVDEIHDEIVRISPGSLSFVCPGYVNPTEVSILAYKSLEKGVAGMIFHVPGDVSMVLGKTAYQTTAPFDVQKDIDEFIETQKQVFRARSSPVVSRTPMPTNWDGKSGGIGEF